MPSFQSPLPSENSRLLKRKLHESEQSEIATSKRHASAAAFPNGSGGHTQYWMVQWRAPQAKKHKTWEGDGVLVVTKPKAALMDLEGRMLTSGNIGSNVLESGVQLTVGNKELEIDRAMQPSEYLSGACFGRGDMSDAPLPPLTNSVSLSRQFVPLRPVALNPSTVRPPTAPKISVSQRKVIELEPVTLLSEPTASSSKEQPGSGDNAQSYWTANWRRPQHKKHKTWDGDAYVTRQGKTLVLVSERGKILGRKPFENLRLTCGLKTFIGGLEIELDSRIAHSEFPKITGTLLGMEEEHENQPSDDIEIVDVQPSAGPTGGSASPIKNSASSGVKFIPPTTFYAKPLPKPRANNPMHGHDPRAEGAVVMQAPDEEHSNKFNKKSLPIVPVVIDPILARRLRPHQVEGVKFMYECVMGLRKHEGQGCILADEMGLGKTLQTITLIWTLLKQNPYAGAGPVVGKVLIVCPVTLVNNWKSEFQKWLGRDRVGVLTADKGKTAIRQFVNSKIHQVLLIGYERLRTVVSHDKITHISPPIGLIVADEGHRLKSVNNKTSTMFGVLKTPRRIILSGTPIQNDLGEFHAMVNDNEYSSFRRVYETPIIRSREPGCSEKEAKLGESRSAQLLAISRSFVLRRDASILKRFLPPKYEYVVFVTPTALQLSIFSKILNPDPLILLKAVADKAKAKISQGQDSVERTTVVEEAVKLLPERARVEDVSLSGKLTAIANLLRAIKRHTDEKCIVVSHYTSTLNILEAFCKKKSYSYLRLDGSEHVNTFNKSSQERCFLFLLSSKAGGVGLNLVGASRLCLIDSDWNPSHDLQSMARIHRDGQKRSVYIYRFLTTGTIDEKIYQRQITKLGLSRTLIGGKSDSNHDLLDCFCDRAETSDDVDAEPVVDTSIDDSSRLNAGAAPGFIVASQVKSVDSQQGDKAYLKKKKAELAALGEWTHINCLKPDASERVQDQILCGLLPRLPSPQIPQVAHSGESSKSRISALLDAVDLDNVSRLGSEPEIDDVPGGTISFLFEKGTSMAGDEDDGPIDATSP
ncbi:SNF2 family N-terminal domain-containing protein [Lactarius indigo]|nr:SNF2 family N-terminal domain-containing protein [Lactarius indigo]